MDEILSLMGLVFMVLGFCCIFAGFMLSYIYRNIDPLDIDL